MEVVFREKCHIAGVIVPLDGGNVSYLINAEAIATNFSRKPHSYQPRNSSDFFNNFIIYSLICLILLSCLLLLGLDRLLLEI